MRAKRGCEQCIYLLFFPRAANAPPPRLPRSTPPFHSPSIPFHLVLRHSVQSSPIPSSPATSNLNLPNPIQSNPVSFFQSEAAHLLLPEREWTMLLKIPRVDVTHTGAGHTTMHAQAYGLILTREFSAQPPTYGQATRKDRGGASRPRTAP